MGALKEVPMSSDAEAMEAINDAIVHVCSAITEVEDAEDAASYATTLGELVWSRAFLALAVSGSDAEIAFALRGPDEDEQGYDDEEE